MRRQRQEMIDLAHPLRMSANKYRLESGEGIGYCQACGEQSESYCEPDAREYRCSNCGEMAVMGLEQLLVEELVEII